MHRRFVQNYDEQNPRTHQGMNLRRISMGDVYKQFGLGEMTIDFIGHAIALHRDDSYIAQPAMDTVLKVKLYYSSLTRFEGTASPYIYPLYGLGELPQVGASFLSLHKADPCFYRRSQRCAVGVPTGVVSETPFPLCKLSILFVVCRINMYCSCYATVVIAAARELHQPMVNCAAM